MYLYHMWIFTTSRKAAGTIVVSLGPPETPVVPYLYLWDTPQIRLYHMCIVRTTRTSARTIFVSLRHPATPLVPYLYLWDTPKIRLYHIYNSKLYHFCNIHITFM